MINVVNIEGAGESCNSGNSEHSGDAIITLFIGDPDIDGEPATHMLCGMCATKTFNAFGFMLSSITGKSAAELLGGKKKR